MLDNTEGAIETNEVDFKYCRLFVTLDGLPELGAKMLHECHERDIKNTILLAGEGINMFLAVHLD